MLTTKGSLSAVLLASNLFIGNSASAQDIKDKYQSNVPADEVKELTAARNLRVAGKPDQAIVSLIDLTKRDPRYFSAQYNLGLAYLDKKETDKAIEALENAAKLKREMPTGISDASIFNSLGWAYMERGNAAKAEASFKEGEANVSSLSEESKRRLWSNMGWLYMNTGRMNEAEKYLKMVSQKYDSAFARDNLKIIEGVKAQQAVGVLLK